MTMYAILSNNTITAHGPARVLWPDTSFPPSGPNASFLQEAGAVTISSTPPHDPETQDLQPVEPYLLDGVVYNREAVAKPEPPAPAPNYLTFWDAVLTSQTYATLLGHAMTSLPTNTALTAFIAAFQDAKEGRPSPGAIQACIFLVMDAAQAVLTAEHLAELQGLMDTHHLSDTYTLTPPA